MKLGQLVQKASFSVAQVRQDSSVRLTLYLLLGVLSLGVISALGGYLFGHGSLKGVTQPDMNPFVGTSASQGQYPRQGNYLIKESDILAKVEKQTKGIAKSSESKKQEKPAHPKAGSAKASPAPKADQPVNTKLPLSVQAQGVRLEVRSLKVEEGSVTLDVAMQNNGSKDVQFLYDFLDISDDQSQFLSSEVNGLPAKFPAKSETYSGVIKVSGISPSSTQWISLALADYPDQKVELKVPKILVKQ